MSGEIDVLTEKVEWLAEEVLSLKESLGDISRRLNAIESGNGTETSQSSIEKVNTKVTKTKKPVPPLPEDSWTQVSQEVLLPRVAAVSFMMVVALILRTVTDNGMLNMVFGSYIGMTYSALLIGAGAVLYKKKSRLAPVFPTCGALLLFSILFETNVRFSSLSDMTANSILLISVAAIASIGLQCRSKILLTLSAWGATAVGFAIGYPEPQYVVLGSIVLLNCIVAHLAYRKQISNKLRWLTLFFASIFWGFWSYKLNYSFQLSASCETTAPIAGVLYFLPMLLLFVAFFTYSSLWKILKSNREVCVFHSMLPAVVSGGAFFAAYAVVNPWLCKPAVVGLSAVFVSACYMGLVAWLVKRTPGDVAGGKEFVVAATVLLLQGLAVTLPVLYALPIWTIAAGALTIRSYKWQSGGIRAISYLFQVLIMGFALKDGCFINPEQSWFVAVIISGGLSYSLIWLYMWCRKNVPVNEGVFYSFLDKKDISAVVLLLLGLGHAFFMTRGIFVVMLEKSISDPANAIYCTQSIIINIGIVFLLIVGLKKRNKELLMVAGLLVPVAALKVFIFDLFRANGLPLVLSVFSFGIVAAVSSVVMRKWQGTEKIGDQSAQEEMESQEYGLEECLVGAVEATEKNPIK